MDLVGKRCWGKLGCPFLAKNPVEGTTISPSQNLSCVQTEIKNPQKRIIQTIMVSTRSSDYAAIGSGGNGIGGKSQLSRLLARGLPPGGEEEKDNDSTPVAFDANDKDGGKIV